MLPDTIPYSRPPLLRTKKFNGMMRSLHHRKISAATIGRFWSGKLTAFLPQMKVRILEGVKGERQGSCRTPSSVGLGHVAMLAMHR